MAVDGRGGDGPGPARTGETPIAAPASGSPPGAPGGAAGPDDPLSLVALDLRSPAASLLRHARRVQRDTGTLSPTLRRSMEAIERHASRIRALADGLLTLRAVERGDVQVDRHPAELGLVLARVVEGLRPGARARGLSLDCDLPSSGVHASVDEPRLAELVQLLVEIVIGGTARGGHVRVSLAPHAAGARIGVERQGEATRPRGRGARGRPYGHGVRLALCHALADLLGGALEAPLGDPRRALLLLPLHAPAEGRPPPPRLPLGGARVLVVDDEPDARDALAQLLEGEHEVVVAADGKEAVELALATRPDVVLMDLYMPRMNGLAALEALRAEPSTADVPVILVSGRGDELTRSHSLDVGAVDFLQKPFSPRELKSRLDRTLRLTRRETQLQALARTDALTGLPNLRAFRDRLGDEVKRARRYRTPLACVMLDMDHLKPINDELGHAAGDLAIGAVAEVLRRELRETDFGARYGGDEFVLLLPHATEDEARVFAERVSARLHEASIEVGGRRLPLSASFGVAELSEEGAPDVSELLLQRADAALYAAKHAGRGRVATHRDAGHPDQHPDPSAP